MKNNVFMKIYKNRNKLVLYTVGLVFLVSITNTFINASSEPKMPLKAINSNIKLKDIKKKKFQSLKYLRKKELDSLIDNNLFTKENIRKVYEKYPDSLCGC